MSNLHFVYMRQFIKDKTVVNRYWEVLIFNSNYQQENFQLNYLRKKIRNTFEITHS